MIRSFNNINPEIHETAYIDEQSTVIGNVKIGKDSAIWPQVVVRGDINSITIGDRTNIQDGSILHVTHASDFCPSGYSFSIGNDVTVGHSAVIHACTIKDTVLIGMGSIILDGAIINSNCMLEHTIRIYNSTIQDNTPHAYQYRIFNGTCMYNCRMTNGDIITDGKRIPRWAKVTSMRNM